VRVSGRRRVALFVVHGIGAQRRDWADRFVERVREEVRRLAADVDVHTGVAWWAPVIQRYEDRLVRRVTPGLWWGFLRRLVIGYAGDIIAYRSPSRVWVPAPWTYRAVHERLNRRLQDLLRDVVSATGALPARPVPLVTVAHSLGSVIFSDFVYDLQTGVAPPRGFARHYHFALRGLFTLGSPLALYALRFPQLGFHAPVALEPGSAWINVLYKADVVAYPLRGASLAHARTVEDCVLRPRLWPHYWTPFAHLAYWNDRRCIRRVAQALAGVAEPSVA